MYFKLPPMKTFFLYLLTPVIAISQTYNGPESIEFYPLTESYFISNANNGQILELNSINELSIFASNIGNGPHGLEIVDDILYACSGSRLKGYNVNDGSQVLNFNIGGTFLNGITHYIDSSGSYLFLTDFTSKKLYRYRIEDKWASSICDFPRNPNGIFLNPMYNILYVVTWGNNAPIYEVDFTTEEFYTATITDLNNLDGISMDPCGNYLISAWSTNSIHRYSNDFSENETIISGLSNPADIYYNQENNILSIPNSGNNTVDLIEYDFDFPWSTNPEWEYSCNTIEIQENKTTKKLIRQIDLLGRENKNNQIYFEIYNNGSVEKKCLIK